MCGLCPGDVMTATAIADCETVIADFADIGIDPNSIRSWAVHPDPIWRRNRNQAIVTFPIFVALLVRSPDVPIHREIEAAIDRGDRLVEMLSSLLLVSKKSIRFLRGKGPALLGTFWLHHPSDLFEAVDQLVPEKLPRTREDWEILRELWTGCSELTEEDYCLRPPPSRHSGAMSRHMLGGLCAAGYSTSARKLRRLWNGDLRPLAGVKDYFRFVAEWCESGAGICKKAGYGEIVAGTIRDELLMRYPAMEIIHQSERWHREIADLRSIEAACNPDPDSHEWPPLPGLPLRVGELAVCSLTNIFQLQLEGARLHHCVRSYFRKCLRGDSHIASIRSGDGTSLSTAELVIGADQDGRLSARVLQHQADHNGNPTRESMLALAEALRVLGSDQVQRQLHELRSFHAERREEIDDRLALGEGRYQIETLCQIMKKVLRDYDSVITWLDKRLNDEEGWYRYRNELAGERQSRLGFADELTYERAFEIFWATGIESCLDEGVRMNGG